MEQPFPLETNHPLSIESWLLRQRIIDLREQKTDDNEIEVLLERQHKVWLLNVARNAKLIRKYNRSIINGFVKSIQINVNRLMWWIVGAVGIISYNVGFVRGVFHGSNKIERFMNYCDNVLGRLGIKKEQ